MRREGTPAWMQVVDRVWNKRSRRPEPARSRRRSATCIPVGQIARGVARTRLALKSMTGLIRFGGASVCRKAPLNQPEVP